MPMIRCVLCALVLVLGLCVAVNDGQGAPRATKQTKGPTVNPNARAAANANKVRQDNVLVAELRHVHAILKAADPIYNGHRGKAMAEVNHAIGSLEKEMKARGLKAHDKHMGNVPKVVSHQLMANSAQAIKTIMAQLASAQKTGHRTTAGRHLQKAVNEIGLGLAFASRR